MARLDLFIDTFDRSICLFNIEFVTSWYSVPGKAFFNVKSSYKMQPKHLFEIYCLKNHKSSKSLKKINHISIL